MLNAEEETHIEQLHDLVADMLCFKHPIVFDDNIDLRKLGKEGQLKKKKKNLNLRKLQEMCEFLKTNTSDVKRQKQKAPYTEKIEELIQDQCTCLLRII